MTSYRMFDNPNALPIQIIVNRLSALDVAVEVVQSSNPTIVNVASSLTDIQINGVLELPPTISEAGYATARSARGNAAKSNVASLVGRSVDTMNQQDQRTLLKALGQLLGAVDQNGVVLDGSVISVPNSSSHSR